MLGLGVLGLGVLGLGMLGLGMLGLGVLGLGVLGLGRCECVWWVYELAVGKQVMYGCTIQFCGCEYLISYRVSVSVGHSECVQLIHTLDFQLSSGISWSCPRQCSQRPSLPTKPRL